MIPLIRTTLAALILLSMVLVKASSAQTKTATSSLARTLDIAHSPGLQAVVDGAVDRTPERFAP